MRTTHRISLAVRMDPRDKPGDDRMRASRRDVADHPHPMPAARCRAGRRAGGPRPRHLERGGIRRRRRRRGPRRWCGPAPSSASRVRFGEDLVDSPETWAMAAPTALATSPCSTLHHLRGARHRRGSGRRRRRRRSAGTPPAWVFMRSTTSSIMARVRAEQARDVGGGQVSDVPALAELDQPGGDGEIGGGQLVRRRRRGRGSVSSVADARWPDRSGSPGRPASRRRGRSRGGRACGTACGRRRPRRRCWPRAGSPLQAADVGRGAADVDHHAVLLDAGQEGGAAHGVGRPRGEAEDRVALGHGRRAAPCRRSGSGRASPRCRSPASASRRRVVVRCASPASAALSSADVLALEQADAAELVRQRDGAAGQLRRRGSAAARSSQAPVSGEKTEQTAAALRPDSRSARAASRMARWSSGTSGRPSYSWPPSTM
jgi:hypothetical protein